MFALFAAALLAASPAQGQAGMEEPMCPYDMIREAARAGKPSPDPVETIAACQARYHWDDATTARARMITVSMLMYQEAAHDAQAAGVDPKMVDAVFAGLTPAQVAAYGVPGKPAPAGANDAVGEVVRQFMARGLSGNTLKKAHTMLTLRAATANLLADFRAAH